MYNVNSHENKEKTLNGEVCPNFRLVVYIDIGIVNNHPTIQIPFFIHFCLFVLEQSRSVEIYKCSAATYRRTRPEV